MSKSFCPKCTLPTTSKEAAKCIACLRLVHQLCKLLTSEFRKITAKNSEFYFLCNQCASLRIKLNKTGDTVLSHKNFKSESATSVQSTTNSKLSELEQKLSRLTLLEREAKNKIESTESMLRTEIETREEKINKVLQIVDEKDHLIAELMSKIDDREANSDAFSGDHASPVKRKRNEFTIIKEEESVNLDTTMNDGNGPSTILPSLAHGLLCDHRVPVIDVVSSPLKIISVRHSSTTTSKDHAFDLAHGDTFDLIVDREVLRFDAYVNTEEDQFDAPIEPIGKLPMNDRYTANTSRILKTSTRQSPIDIDIVRSSSISDDSPRSKFDVGERNFPFGWQGAAYSDVSPEIEIFLPDISSISLAPSNQNINYPLKFQHPIVTSTSSSYASETQLPIDATFPLRAEVNPRNTYDVNKYDEIKNNSIVATVMSGEEPYDHESNTSFTDDSYENFSTGDAPMHNKYVILHNTGTLTFNKAAIAERIITENDWIRRESFDVRSIYMVRTNKRTYANAILCCDDDLHRRLTTKDALIQLWEVRRRTFDKPHIKQCANCLRFGHDSPDCAYDAICKYCLGWHRSDTCMNQSKWPPTCPNCSRANEQGASFGIRHNPYHTICSSRMAYLRMENVRT